MLSILYPVQGVSVIQKAKDACKWARFLYFCCSYDECRQFLSCPGVHQAIRGKCVVQLCSGTPEDAHQMAKILQPLGAAYLDAFVLVRIAICAMHALIASFILLTSSCQAELVCTTSHIAGVQSEGTEDIFNHRLSSMMVSGDKTAWKDVEDVIRAVAPASFYGGYKVEWANTTGVGVLTFITSVRMVRPLSPIDFHISSPSS